MNPPNESSSSSLCRCEAPIPSDGHMRDPTGTETNQILALQDRQREHTRIHRSRKTVPLNKRPCQNRERTTCCKLFVLVCFSISGMWLSRSRQNLPSAEETGSLFTNRKYRKTGHHICVHVYMPPFGLLPCSVLQHLARVPSKSRACSQNVLHALQKSHLQIRKLRAWVWLATSGACCNKQK